MNEGGMQADAATRALFAAFMNFQAQMQAAPGAQNQAEAHAPAGGQPPGMGVRMPEPGNDALIDPPPPDIPAGARA